MQTTMDCQVQSFFCSLRPVIVGLAIRFAMQGLLKGVPVLEARQEGEAVKRLAVGLLQQLLFDSCQQLTECMSLFLHIILYFAAKLHFFL